MKTAVLLVLWYSSWFIEEKKINRTTFIWNTILFIYNAEVFTVTFGRFNVPFLNKSIHFPLYWPYTLEQ